MSADSASAATCAPRVFIQYTHDSSAHKERVRLLADGLRHDGVESMVDQYVESPPEGWETWMDKQLRDSDYVLVVCTAANYRRFWKEEEPGKGLGATWEGHLIRVHLYRAGVINDRLIPVLFEAADAAFIPEVLQSFRHYRLHEPDGYDRLFRRLTQQPEVEVPEVGPLRKMPTRRSGDAPPHVEPLGAPRESTAKLPSVSPMLFGRERELGREDQGLCILTTRLAVADLAEFEGTTMRRLELENLSPEAGAEYLKALGVEGTPGELEQASRDFGGHALALGMLGDYVKVVCDGDVRKRDTIGPLIEEEHRGGHARRVMRSYARYFEGQPEGALLRLMGLFDRPADGPAVEVLKAAPAIKGLTGELVGLPDKRWKLALHHLGEAKLLAPQDKHEPETLDCHPLVREHFGEEVWSSNPKGWKKAHLRLYDHYKRQGKDYPDTLGEMAPLFAAVSHGCQAGRHQEVLDEVYWRRIRRRQESYLLHKLGAFGANLALLANFFELPWRRPVAGLKKSDDGWVLVEAGFSLRALGRLSEAVEPMEAGLKAFVAQGKWRAVARGAGSLSELHLTLGNVTQAIEAARRSVEHADRSGESFERMVFRTALADTLHQAGQVDEAAKLFAEAEAIQKELDPQYPLLYSLRGYLYCDLLLAQGKQGEVLSRATQTLEWVTEEHWLLDIALDNLSLGVASAPESAEAAAQLDEAVEGLRKAGHEDYLPRGLLARAALRRQRGDFAAAQHDLAEAFALATRCGMRLHLTDYHLEQARLFAAQDDCDNAHKHLAAARDLIAATGYHRRDPEVQELDRDLGLG